MPTVQRIKVIQQRTIIIFKLDTTGLFHDFPYLTINFRLIFLIVFTTFIMSLFLLFRLSLLLNPRLLLLSLSLIFLRFTIFVNQWCLIIIILSIIIKQWCLHATAISCTPAPYHLARIVLLVVK
jgi:hypothetical protein